MGTASEGYEEREPRPRLHIRARHPPGINARRVLSVVAIVFVAAAFAVATLTRGEGWLFTASTVCGAVMLIVIVFLVAFGGARTPHRESPPDGFAAFEKAAQVATRGGLLAGPQGAGPAGDLSEPAVDGASKGSARAFVLTLVPIPAYPSTVSSVAARKEFLDSLRREGTGLIRLAKVIDVDIAPYQAFLADAREAALLGDTAAPLRSLQLANELLRATLEKALIKRRSAGQEIPDLLED